MTGNYKKALGILAATASVAAALWAGSLLTDTGSPEPRPSREMEDSPQQKPRTKAERFDPSTDSTDQAGPTSLPAVHQDSRPVEDRIVHADDHFEDETGDLAIYRSAPMSTVPHIVARGWGMGAGSLRPGVVGAVVIVDPGIANASLEKLLRDIHAYHSREDAVSVRIMDDARAATYDRHDDGGDLAQRHLVAQIVRNQEVGIDEMRIGDRVLEP